MSVYGSCGSVCQCMAVYSSVCQCMAVLAVYVSVWQFITVYVSVWQCMSVYGSVWQCLNNTMMMACAGCQLPGTFFSFSAKSPWLYTGEQNTASHSITLIKKEHFTLQRNTLLLKTSLKSKEILRIAEKHSNVESNSWYFRATLLTAERDYCTIPILCLGKICFLVLEVAWSKSLLALLVCTAV